MSIKLPSKLTLVILNLRLLPLASVEHLELSKGP